MMNLSTQAPAVEYLPDDAVDEALDRMLRALLCSCFTKPQDVVFQTRRYFREPYPHRWILRRPGEALLAHAGVHDKCVVSGGRSVRIGGICEVCVRPDFRGRGYVKAMLARIHAWMGEQGFDFALLFGDPGVYGSSGYAKVDNLVHGSDLEGWKPVKPLVHSVSGLPWPRHEVRLTGPTF